MEDKTDSWWDFVDWYYNQSEYQSIPLSYILLPSAEVPGFRTPGSPLGCLKISKKEYNKLMRKEV